eukprot:10278708-Alexandrium_andersonii.AAC.1
MQGSGTPCLQTLDISTLPMWRALTTALLGWTSKTEPVLAREALELARQLGETEISTNANSAL